MDIAEYVYCRLCREGIKSCCGEIRLQKHIGFVDGSPSGDGGAVEHNTVRQQVFVDSRDMLRRMLQLSAHVGKAEGDIFNVVFF